MPRELLQIGKFNTGIIGVVDEQDIPADASSFALETDVDATPGKLSPRYDDSVFSASIGRNANTNAFIVNDDGSYDLVYYDKADGDINAIVDFYNDNAAQAESALDTTNPGTSATVAMQSHNKAVHLGWGSTSATPAKWIGKISYKPFGDTTVTGLQYVDAELAPPQTLPYLYKMCGTDGTYIYGIEWRGTKIYRIPIAGGTITASTETFVSTQGVCEFLVAGTGNYLLLYDKDGPFGSVHKFNKSTMLIEETYRINGFGLLGKYPGSDVTLPYQDTGYEVSDIELSADSTGTQKLWFGASWREDGDACEAIDTIASSTAGYIYQYSGNMSNGSSYTLSAINPILSANGAAADGKWVSATAIFKPIKRCFVKTAQRHTGEIVFLAQFSTASGLIIDGVTYTDGKIYIANAIAQSYVGMAGIVMNGSTAQGALLNSTNCKLFQISSGGTTKYTSAIQLIDTATPGTGFLLTGEGAGVVNIWMNAYDDASANNHTWSIAGANWKVSGGGFIFHTMLSTNSQAQKYGNIINSSVVKITNSNDTDTGYTYGEQSLESVSRSLANTIDTITHAFDIAQAYVQHGFGLTPQAYADGQGDFTAGKKFYYKCSFEYDGVQESPLFLTIPETATLASTESVLITIEIPLALLPSYRATAVKVYRAESDSALSQPSTLYRLVERVPIGDVFWGSDANLWATRRLRTFIDHGVYQASYETETEISETRQFNYLNYQISTQYQGFHFVTQAYSEFFGNDKTGNFLFRSKRNKYDQFDVAVDFLVLPKRANALSAFAGSVWAFADNEIYRINPQGLFIEDIIQGIGCNWSNGVCVTNEGMFWGDKNNAYMHDGQQIQPIGEAIKIISNSNGTSYGYRAIVQASGRQLFVVPFRKYGYIVFVATSTTSGAPTAYAYHLPTQSWHIWTFSAGNKAPHGMIAGRSGEIYVSDDDGLQTISGDSGRKSMTWYSKDLTLEEPSAVKSWVDLNIHNFSGSNTTTVSFDDAAFGAFAGLSRKKKMQIKVTGSGIIEAIGIVFRRLKGYTSANT